MKDDQQCAAELNGPLGPSSRADHKHQSHPLKSMNLQSVEVEDSKPCLLAWLFIAIIAEMQRLQRCMDSPVRQQAKFLSKLGEPVDHK